MVDESILSEFLGDGDRPRRRRELESAASYVAMLDVVLEGGNRLAFPYAMLLKIEFDPSTGITLRFSTDDVVIEGRRLGPLYRSLVQHRTPRVRAGGKSSRFTEKEGGPVITAIRCRPAK